MAALSCAATSKKDQFDDSASGAGAGSSSGVGGDNSSSAGVGGDFTGSTSAGTGGSTPGCAQAATLVYVLSSENDLYSFDPPNKVFKKIGPLGCNNGMSPNSMAVDRNATAWVNYVQNDGFQDSAGAIYKVNTQSAACEGLGVNLPSSWYRLGMGFASDMAGGTAETLYVASTGDIFNGLPSPGIAKINFASKQLVPFGQFSGTLNGQSAELTGTGDARLFGFFTTTPVEVAEIAKDSGSILSQKKLPQVETPTAWAFSFWGGDFYLYTAPSDPNRTSNVTRYRPSDNSVDPNYMVNVGFHIVGAGVSTCAPVAPPK
jgi:hypothetical protein